MVAGEAIPANLLPELIFLIDSLEHAARIVDAAAVETLEALRAQARREKDA
jgi:hypothetical protein